MLLPPRHPKNLGIILASVLLGKPKGHYSHRTLAGDQYSVTLTRGLQPTAWLFADPRKVGQTDSFSLPLRGQGTKTASPESQEQPTIEHRLLNPVSHSGFPECVRICQASGRLTSLGKCAKLLRFAR